MPYGCCRQASSIISSRRARERAREPGRKRGKGKGKGERERGKGRAGESDGSRVRAEGDYCASTDPEPFKPGSHLLEFQVLKKCFSS